MKNKLTSLSIFFPAFNEEENIVEVVKLALTVAPRVSQKYEIIVVDDGSRDRTAEKINAFSKTHPLVKLVSHKKNMGYGAALKTGFKTAKYDYITYMDSDRQFDFSDLTKLVEKIDEADVVVGFRKKRADRLIRIINGKLWNLLCSIVLGLRIKDIDCGFKLVSAKVLKNIPPLESNGATISAELLVKAKKHGFVIKQVGLDHKNRLYGAATGGNPLHIFRAFYDLLNILPKV